MKRRRLPLFAIFGILLLAAALILWLRAPGAPVPIAEDLPQAEPADPMRAEMACIDRVLQDRTLTPETAPIAVENCRGGRGAAAALNRQ